MASEAWSNGAAEAIRYAADEMGLRGAKAIEEIFGRLPGGGHETMVLMERRAIPAKPATRHARCAYCGTGGDAWHICGACREAGIDGPLIRGTGARKRKPVKRWAMLVQRKPRSSWWDVTEDSLDVEDFERNDAV